MEEEDFVQDSEPEREKYDKVIQSGQTIVTSIEGSANLTQKKKKKMKKRDSSLIILGSTSPSSDDDNDDRLVVEQPSATSHYFSSNPTHLSPTKRRRKTKSLTASPVKLIDSLLLPTSHQPIRTEPIVPVASTSSLEVTTGTSFKVPTIRSKPKTTRVKKPKSTPSFTTAADLLKASPTQSYPPPTIDLPLKKPSTASKKKKVVESNSISLSDSTSTTTEDEVVSNKVCPPRLDYDEVTRILFDLPPLVKKPSLPSTSTSTPSAGGKRKKPWELASTTTTGDESSDLDGAGRMRNSLAQFRYREGSAGGSTSNLTDHDYSASLDEYDHLDLKIKATTSFTRLEPPKPQITLPPNDRIKVLTACPLCMTKWTTTKSVGTKSTHLRTCGIEQDFTSETVGILIEKFILAEAKILEGERREKERNKTLFDRTVGKGEGRKFWREVKAVGIVKGGGGEGGFSSSNDQDLLLQFQKELDDDTKKQPIDKLVKVAKEIKQLMKEREIEAEKQKKQAEAERIKREQEEDESYWEDQDPTQITQVIAPRPTGRLVVHSTARMKVVAKRVEQVLGGRGGTGLTQIALPLKNQSNRSISSLLPQSRTSITTSMNVDNDDNEPLPLPKSTQTFEPSKLAQRLVETSQVKGVSLPMKGVRRSISPLVTRNEFMEVDREEENEVRVSSLWEAATGNDDATIDKVVRSSSPSYSSSSPSFSPPRISSSISTPLRLSPSSRHPNLFLPSSISPIVTNNQNLSSRDSISPLNQNRLLKELHLSDKNVSSLQLKPEEKEGMRTPGLGREEEEEESEDEDEDEWRQEGAEEGMLIWEGGNESQGTGEEEEEGESSGKSKKKEKGKGKEIVLILGDTSSSSSSSSSEEEPLTLMKPKLKAKGSRQPKSPTKKKPRKPPISASKKTKTKPKPPPSLAVQSGAPDYSSMTTLELQTQITQYGYRISKERSVLIDQLEEVWFALNPGKKVVIPEKAKLKGKGKAKEVEEEGGNVGERVRKLIMEEEELYLEILRYEPIFFDEFVTLVAQKGLKVTKPILMRCLDELCITIYTQDPNAGGGGSRTRHR